MTAIRRYDLAGKTLEVVQGIYLLRTNQLRTRTLPPTLSPSWKFPALFLTDVPTGYVVEFVPEKDHSSDDEFMLSRLLVRPSRHFCPAGRF
jgi:hypothetical protein